MKITQIKNQVKNTERLSVYVDGNYAFSVNYAQVLDLKLRVGLEIDEAQLAAFKKASDFGKAYERALNYVMIRPRSRREVQDYCRRKKWSSEDCQVILEKLIAKRYVDDHNFAHAWVESRKITKPLSTRRLRMELKQKGIADNIIADVLADQEYSEGDALMQTIAKKRRIGRYAADPQKLIQYLARQGFSYDDIKAALADE